MEGMGSLMNDLQGLITTVGFPVVACFYMYKQQLVNEANAKEQQKATNDMMRGFIETLKGIETTMLSLDSEIRQLKQDTEKFKIPKEYRG